MMRNDYHIFNFFRGRAPFQCILVKVVCVCRLQTIVENKFGYFFSSARFYFSRNLCVEQVEEDKYAKRNIRPTGFFILYLNLFIWGSFFDKRTSHVKNNELAAIF